ncbi:MAG: hypothetical protein WAN69_20490 [Candidatus Korobacteraceae bacterium]
MFQRRNRCVSFNGGKVIQEIVQTLPTLKIVEQRLERYAGTPKYGNSTQYIPIFHDDLIHIV